MLQMITLLTIRRHSNPISMLKAMKSIFIKVQSVIILLENIYRLAVDNECLSISVFPLLSHH